jgi:chaperonin GroES
MLDVTPLNKRVIAMVLETNEAEKTVSGIILEEKSRKENFLEVVAVDPQITDIKVGDKIYISKYSGDSYKEGQKEFYYIEYKDIIGKKNNG